MMPLSEFLTIVVQISLTLVVIGGLVAAIGWPGRRQAPAPAGEPDLWLGCSFLGDLQAIYDVAEHYSGLPRGVILRAGNREMQEWLREGRPLKGDDLVPPGLRRRIMRACIAEQRDRGTKCNTK